jgi:predicted amidohydrolase YtcJ
LHNEKISRLKEGAPSFGLRTLLLAGVLTLLTGVDASAQTAADAVYRNGYVYTADSKDSVQKAIAVQDGRIVYVGNDIGVKALIGDKTRVIDLEGRMLAPGLIDGHLHPLEGGVALQSCNLNFDSLTLAEFQARIQACLDAEKDSAPDAWLMVTAWYRQAMQPEGTNPGAEALDVLKTKRPIIVQSSDYHSVLANSRAMELAGIADNTANPAGGSIIRDAKGKATGIFEDQAGDMINAARPATTPQDKVTQMQLALKAMSAQGVTTFLDALADESHLTAFATIAKGDGLTARSFAAVYVGAEMADKTTAATETVKKLAKQYDSGALDTAPAVSVRHAKIMLDGVVQAPAQTAGLLKPYLENKGSDDHPDFRPGTHAGDVYWKPDALKKLLASLAAIGINPHIHAIGDRSVREALDAVAYMRQQPGGKKVRAGLAHVEVTDPADFKRFAELDVLPVMSFQWAKPAPDSIDAAKDFLGPDRFARLEPEGSLHAAGARIAFGSDWPVDPFNEWFALKVGITRTNDSTMWDKYPGSLNEEAGLPRVTALRAATINAAYELGAEKEIGSLEPGKMADFIVLDRNFFDIAAEDIGNIKVLLTVVGGKTVYDTGDLH